MKRATVYKRGESVIVHAMSKTTAGVWILTPPVACVSMADTVRLSQAVVSALNNSTEDVVHPTSWKGRFDPVLKLAGVKTFSAFIKTCRCLEVELDAGQITLIPTRNLGSSGGFEPIGMKIGPVEFTDQGTLGKWLLSAFDSATDNSKKTTASSD